MKSMETKLNEEMRQLENIIKATEKRLQDAPKGHLRISKKRWKVIQCFLNQYRESNPKKVYDDISMYRKDLLEVAIISDREYCNRWENIEYDGKGFHIAMNIQLF